MTTNIQVKTSKLIRHLGKRPKNDQDNHCRERLSELVRDVGCFYEICPEKLFMVCLSRDESAVKFCDHKNDAKCPFIFWSLYDSPTLNYEAFNEDFGPFNLATTHLFCSKLKVWFDTIPYRDTDKHVVIVLDDLDLKKKLNMTLLVAIAAMVLLNLSAQEVIQRLGFFMMPKALPGKKHKDLVFRQRTDFSDVSGNFSAMRLTLEDCIQSFYAALHNKFYEYYEFDHPEYIFYETVMSGDLNWIIPGKILAFAGPSDEFTAKKFYHKRPPEFYHDYFNDHNVSDIIRLNDSEYKKSGFENHGFKHHDLIFPDGYPPTSSIAGRFIRIVDEAKGAVAVHCYAGIGRTGTLIAAYLMTRYNFTPQMAIAWTRICRPGSVIGEQQDWLLTRFDQYSIARSPTKQAKNKKLATEASVGSGVDLIIRPGQEATERATVAEGTNASQNHGTNTNYEADEKTLGQAKALVLAKRQRENPDKPNTRNTVLRAAEADEVAGPATSSTSSSSNRLNNPTKRVDVVLDLGMTIPFMLSLTDFLNLDEGENPEFYRIKDGKYEWKVKFPKKGYVALKHDRNKDLEAAEFYGLDVESITREPLLDFKYDYEVGQQVELGVPKKKPVVYFSLVSSYETT